MNMELTHGELRHLLTALDGRIDMVRGRMADRRLLTYRVNPTTLIDAYDELKTLRLRVIEAIRDINPRQTDGETS